MKVKFRQRLINVDRTHTMNRMTCVVVLALAICGVAFCTTSAEASNTTMSNMPSEQSESIETSSYEDEIITAIHTDTSEETETNDLQVLAENYIPNPEAFTAMSIEGVPEASELIKTLGEEKEVETTGETVAIIYSGGTAAYKESEIPRNPAETIIMKEEETKRKVEEEAARLKAEAEAKRITEEKAAAEAAAKEAARQKEASKQYLGKFTLTAYCSCKKCCGRWSPEVTGKASFTESGTNPRQGRTVAVDKHVIPLGTHLMINGHEYIAEDTGSAVDGNHIDVYFSSHAEAKKFGMKKGIDVYRVK